MKHEKIISLYNELNLKGEGEIQEFWEAILTLNGLKPAVLFQYLSNDQQDHILMELDKEEKYGELRFILEDLKRSDLYTPVGSCITSEEWVVKVLKDKDTNSENFLGKILGYECPGDHLAKHVTFVRIRLFPSKEYVSLLSGASNNPIDISGFACERSRIIKLKPKLEMYGTLIDKFFKTMKLGNVKVIYRNRQDD